MARALASGTLELGVGSDPDALRADLLRFDGVGPWTADYVAMRVLGHPDICLPSDAAVRSGWARLVGRTDHRAAPAEARRPSDADDPPSPPALGEALAEVRPWRSYATLHLWRTAGVPGRTAVVGPSAPAVPATTYPVPIDRTDTRP
ncbi:hypothetical protein MN0502_12810 [Arthrobacter sp. MN05-02]|nr:hypothetical protein MN0502_12810 [Arthrobacter sp. MN05-02]